MLTYYMNRLTTKQIEWMIKFLGWPENGITEYFHEIFCACNVDLDAEDLDEVA